jgi:hypothetical protein
MNDPLNNLAARAEGDPFFLGHVLAAFARGERLDTAGLTAALGCRAEDLARVRLCRVPRLEPPGFWQDVTQIAERFGLDAERLAEIVKRGRVLDRWQAGRPGDGFLLAARDQDEETAGDEPEGAV